LVDAGLSVGECVEEAKTIQRRSVADDRVWYQEPVPGTLVPPGAAIDLWMTSGCDIVRGDRIILD